MNTSLTKTKACTDVLVINQDQIIHAHNEDEDENSDAYFLQVTILSNNGTTLENFFAFTYPGNLPGCAFAYNILHNNAISLNSLFPKQATGDGLALNFISRDLMRSTSLYDFENRILELNNNRGSGFNINFSGPRYIATVEFSPHAVDKLQVTTNYTHLNEYRRLSVPQFPDPSSQYRLQRINEIPKPKTIHETAQILGDTKNKQYPVYRNSAPPDDSSTLSSMILLYEMSPPGHTTTSVLLYDSNPKLKAPRWTLNYKN